MLCLTRMIGEELLIGDDIRVKVLSISHNGTVRLGIAAPSGIHIVRKEISGLPISPAPNVVDTSGCKIGLQANVGRRNQRRKNAD